MGRKKSKRKAPAKKQGAKLAKSFDCPICNHESSCEVTIKQDKNVGVVKCNVCDEKFETTTNYLSNEIDVFTDWIDALEAANNGDSDEGPAADHGPLDD
eukprot:m.205702 g.205702  ORF g.205702 m.205702 type:complete len:99 (-) comp18880_c0_seq30:217-513(-)